MTTSKKRQRTTTIRGTIAEPDNVELIKKKATRKRKTNTVVTGSVAHGFNGLRLELELDRPGEGAGYGGLATVLCQLICYQFCYAHLHVCCSSIEYELWKFICVIR